MTKLKLPYILPILLFGAIVFAADFSESKIKKESESKKVLTNDEDNEQNFNKMMSVMTHQRCINCHPSDNVPKQGEDSHPHYFGLERGADNHGFEATNCNTCHQQENNDFSGVPGAPHWHLAPASMNWQGLSKKEIAASILDKSRNGGRSRKEVMEHMTEDPLVLWAFNPGINADGIARETPPVSVNEYIDVVKKWFESGAVIPE